MTLQYFNFFHPFFVQKSKKCKKYQLQGVQPARQLFDVLFLVKKLMKIFKYCKILLLVAVWYMYARILERGQNSKKSVGGCNGQGNKKVLKKHLIIMNDIAQMLIFKLS